MSTFSYSAGKLDRMENRLEELVRAMMVFHAVTLGVTEKFGFTPADVTAARQALAHFAAQLQLGLSGSAVEPEFAPVVKDISEGSRPITDWQADLSDLAQRLQAGQSISEQQNEALQKALGYFRQEVAESANRIRNR